MLPPMYQGTGTQVPAGESSSAPAAKFSLLDCVYQKENKVEYSKPWEIGQREKNTVCSHLYVGFKED